MLETNFTAGQEGETFTVEQEAEDFTPEVEDFTREPGENTNITESKVDENFSVCSSSERFEVGSSHTTNSKKKTYKCCKFPGKCVTIIFVIFLIATIASLLTFLLLPKTDPNSDNFFRLIQDYHVSDIAPFASNDDFRKQNRELLKNLINTNSKLDFWSDKIKTQECLDGVEKGINMVPILWSTRNWDTEQNNLHEFLQNEDNWKNYPRGFILKPAHNLGHLVNSNNNIIKIKNNFNWAWIEQQVNKIPMTKEALEDWQKDLKNFELPYTIPTPGLMLQQNFDISGNPFHEIKFFVVWGKIVGFTYWDEGVVSIRINEEDKFRFCQESALALDKDCGKLEKMMNWDVVIPKLEKFSLKLHLDFVRIDIFPIDYVNFYINGIELDNAQPGKMNYSTLKKLKHLNTILKNSEHSENFFLDPRLHHLSCPIFDDSYILNSPQQN